MDHPRSASGIGEENVGIPDDLRCKRSDGKQWRCTAMSMPDKTVCEKHYIQAKKRAANSAMRANLKKAKRKSLGESDAYLESKSDDFDTPLVNTKAEEYSLPVTKTKYFEKISKNQFRYSPETQTTPQVRSFSVRDSPKLNDDSHVDLMQYEENLRSYKTPPVSAMDSSRNRSQRSFDANAMTVSEYSDQSTESSEETGGQTCHQCRRNDRDRVIWCLKCDRRGYCDSCKSKWYPDISPEDIQKICPACRGNCNCKVCLRGDNLIKVRIREIPALDKLQYLHCLLSSVLPVVKQIHHEQCSEVELEKRLRGTEIDLARTRLNVDEQMCCNFCRIPIIDYHRHCANCSYDLCLSCSRDLREASMACINGVVDDKIGGKSQEKETVAVQVPRFKLNFSDKYPDWKANSDSSIPCPPEEYGGCGYSSLNLNRIFKMNWVAKLVKNVEEMVSGCRVYGDCNVEKIVYDDPRHCQYANREEGDDNFLYCPASEDIKSGGVGEFRRHWAGGEPIIVNQVFDSSSATSWDPMVIWRGIQETADEKLKDGNRMVKATDCFDWSEIDIELGQFIEGYSEGRIHENGRQEMLKLKDWPCPSASEVLLYQRPEFISKLPLLEFIHSKWGLLNVAAKLPHYSLQNDVGPKIFISYGTYEELGRGDSVTNLHFNIRDMVYLLVHTCDVKLSGQQRTTIEKMPHSFKEFQEKDSQGDGKVGVDDSRLPDLSLGECSLENEHCKSLDENKDEEMTDQGIDNTSSVEGDAVIGSRSNENGEDAPEKTRPGVSWDVFRRQDVPKVTEYLRTHQKEFGVPDSETYDFVARPLYDERFYLNGYHKRKLKEEFGVEPWSFEQHLGQAVFVPAGCPFQVRNLQSTVQLGLDFLSPESLGEAVKLAEEIRCLPNDHDAKLQVLEVGKISLYAASSAIKEVQKLVLDPKLCAELGFEDPSLTAAVSDNLEKMTKRRQITCA